MCGGGLVARADDTPQAVQGRLRDYHVKTQPVLDLFRAKEVIVAVDATGPVAQIQAAICAQLKGPGVVRLTGAPARQLNPSAGGAVFHRSGRYG